jgi:7-carboxy-7-deazaguanine synthase
MTEKTYPVIEVFGPTIQGEGAMAGVFTHFVRFGGCDYRCQWCDSDHAVLPVKVRENAKRMTSQEIVDALGALPKGPEWITISGGNPALHDLSELVDMLQLDGYYVAVETQGTVWKDWLKEVEQLTISPKPPSSGMLGKLHPDFQEYLKYSALWQNDLCFKVPVLDERDYDWAIKKHQESPHVPFYFSIVTRMGGLYGDFDGGAVDTTEQVLGRYRWLVERAARDVRAADIRAFPQLHVLLWGHARGV